MSHYRVVGHRKVWDVLGPKDDVIIRVPSKPVADLLATELERAYLLGSLEVAEKAEDIVRGKKGWTQ